MRTFYDHTGLGRAIDLHHASNRVAVIGSVSAGVASLAVRWLATSELDLFASASVAIGVFLAWAIARELDPDRPGAATVAMGMAGVFAFFGPAAPAIAALALVAVRIHAGTVGNALRTADIVVLLAGAGYAGTRPEAWPIAAALTIAVVVDRTARLPWAPAAIATAAVGGAALASPFGSFGMPSMSSIALIAIAAVATMLSRPVGAIVATTDVGRRPISAGRVQAARLAVGIAAIGGGLLAVDGGAALSPVIAALVAVTLAQWLPRPQSLAVAASADQNSHLHLDDHR